MDIITAKNILLLLADGINPITGEILAEDDSCNQGEIVRALNTVVRFIESPPESVTKALPKNAGKPWTELEDDKLRDEFAEKIKISDIAKEHGRTYGAIESRLEHLGLKKKTFWLFRRKNK